MNFLDLGRYKPIALGLFGFTLLIGVVLGFNMFMANLLSSDLSGTRFLARQQIQSELILAHSHTMAARLKTHESITDSFNSLRTAVTRIDQTLSSLANDGSFLDDSVLRVHSSSQI